GLCTYERDDLFFSYRRDRTETGAMIGFMKLNS
ncbi:MAG: laccase domain-containing protein, partial [Clostridia bacterium]|nr:laccase domain-containing protein [Clostridia bacterium]